MLVQQILSSKANSEIISLPPSATLAEAATMLSEKRIGVIIVSKDGKQAEGILSERDIVRELGKRGVVCMADTVDRVMTARLIGCTKSDSAEHVMQTMTDGRFRHMPVMEGDALIGIISIGDVVKARLSELAMEKDALESMIKGF